MSECLESSTSKSARVYCVHNAVKCKKMAWYLLQVLGNDDLHSTDFLLHRSYGNTVKVTLELTVRTQLVSTQVPSHAPEQQFTPVTQEPPLLVHVASAEL